MFGGGTQSSGGGGLFGGASASNNNGGGGGLFGNSSSNNNNNSSGGLFGNSGNNNSNNNSNNNNSGGGIFGSSNTSNTNTGGGLFGGSNTSNANTGGGGGLFGNSNNNNNNNNGGGGLFGGGNTTNNTGGGGGLFGSTNNNATSGGGLFGGGGGNTANNSGGGGLFGNSNNNTGSSGGLFGSSNTSNTGGGGLFGNTNTNSGGGLFGNTGTAGAFGNQQAFQQQQQQQQPQQQQMDNMNQLQNQLGAAPWWYRELSSVYNAYHVGQGSRFQTMLYEVIGMAPELMVHAGAISLSQVDYIKAQRKRMILQNNPWLDQRDYQRAEDNNPDPMNWVPTPIVGVEALHKRVEAQAAYVRSQLEMLGPSPSAASGGSASSANGSNALALIPANETKADEAKTSEQHAALWLRMDAGQGFEEQIEQCRHEHVRLKHRLIRALGRLERLQAIPQRGGRSQAELQYAERLDRLDRAMGDPRGCRAQLTQIVTQLELEDYQDAKGFGSGDLRQANNVMQEQDQEALFNFLELQREGIAKLMDIVKRDMRDLEIIKRKVHAPGAR